jgi:hypothetical protein
LESINHRIDANADASRLSTIIAPKCCIGDRRAIALPPEAAKFAETTQAVKQFNAARDKEKEPPSSYSDGSKVSLAGRRMPSHTNVILIRINCCNPANTP